MLHLEHVHAVHQHARHAEGGALLVDVGLLVALQRSRPRLLESVQCRHACFAFSREDRNCLTDHQVPRSTERHRSYHTATIQLSCLKRSELFVQAKPTHLGGPRRAVVVHADRPLVVLDHEDRGQLVQRGHVEALIELACAGQVWKGVKPGFATFCCVIGTLL